MKIIPTVTQIRGLHILTLPALNPDITNLALTVRLGTVRPHSGTELTLLAELLQTGTTKMDKCAFEMFLKQHGIILNVVATSEGLHFSVRVPTQHTKAAVSLLEEIIFLPLLSDHEFKSKKGTALERNRDAYDNAKLIADINFSRLLLPFDSPYVLPTLKEEALLIKGTTRARLKSLLNRLYTGEWYLSIVGNQTAQTTCLRLQKLLVKTATPAPICVFETSPALPMSYFETVSGKTNVEISMGNRLPLTTSHDDYIPCIFGIAVLGKVGGFSGRLMSTVREKEGLTYGIYATTRLETRERTGFWKIFTFFTARDLAQGIASTVRELTTIVENGITDEELAVFKLIMQNQFILSQGSDWSRLNVYHQAHLGGETAATLEERLAKIGNLTKTQVNQALQTYLNPNALVISGAGPVDETGRGLF